MVIGVIVLVAAFVALAPYWSTKKQIVIDAAGDIIPTTASDTETNEQPKSKSVVVTVAVGMVLAVVTAVSVNFTLALFREIESQGEQAVEASEYAVQVQEPARVEIAEETIEPELELYTCNKSHLL